MAANKFMLKGFFHEQGRRFERWFNPSANLFDSQPPEIGMSLEFLNEIKKEKIKTLPKTVSLFIVPIA
jgi:hypothetical protein